MKSLPGAVGRSRRGFACGTLPPDKRALWPAQYRADRQLEQRPQTAGAELSEGLWQIVEPPLKIFYEIDDANRLVTVTHVEII
jgi:hypothetical protein